MNIYCSIFRKPRVQSLIETYYINPKPVYLNAQMLGATKPSDSAPGTIRGDFALDVGRNICHGSDSVENAEREIALCKSYVCAVLST
jgi:nucleoside diphosphate kinase